MIARIARGIVIVLATLVVLISSAQLSVPGTEPESAFLYVLLMAVSLVVLLIEATRRPRPAKLVAPAWTRECEQLPYEEGIVYDETDLDAIGF